MFGFYIEQTASYMDYKRILMYSNSPFILKFFIFIILIYKSVMNRKGATPFCSPRLTLPPWVEILQSQPVCFERFSLVRS